MVAVMFIECKIPLVQLFFQGKYFDLIYIQTPLFVKIYNRIIALNALLINYIQIFILNNETYLFLIK